MYTGKQVTNPKKMVSDLCPDLLLGNVINVYVISARRGRQKI